MPKEGHFVTNALKESIRAREEKQIVKNAKCLECKPSTERAITEAAESVVPHAKRDFIMMAKA